MDHQKPLRITDAATALKMLAKTEMRPFTAEDWLAFAGCETKDPLIGQADDYAVLLDGDCLSIIHPEDEYGGTIFHLELC